MKLYYSPAACSLSPHIVLCELGLEAELVKVDTRAHRYANGEDYYGVSPTGAVPALELDDGSVLTEGPAVVQYLADLRPQSGLIPDNGTPARYQLQQWLNFLSTEIHKGFVPVFYADQAGAYAATAKTKLLGRFRLLDERLAKQPYVVGNQFTVADCYLFALIGWAQASWLTSWFHLDVQLDEFHHLARWYRQVVLRPAVLQALAEEGLKAA